MFCRYCGRQLKEGEVCHCRESKRVKLIKPENSRKAVNKSKGPIRYPVRKEKPPILPAALFLLAVASFLLLRFGLTDVVKGTGLEGIYPYLIYIVPAIFAITGLSAALFLAQDREKKAGPVFCIFLNFASAALIISSIVLFPYEDTNIEKASGEEIAAENEEQVRKQEEENRIEEIQGKYDTGVLDYAGVKNEISSIEGSLNETEQEAAETLKKQIETDLTDKIKSLAEEENYQELMKELEQQSSSLGGEDSTVENLRSTYETEYIAYLQEESTKLAGEGNTEAALNILDIGKGLVRDTDSVDKMIQSVEEKQQESDRDYIIADSDRRYLTEGEIRNLTLKEINYAKNEIYARHGRKFKSAELQNYFNSKSWYHGTIEPDDFQNSYLNDHEQKNTELLSKVEHSISSDGYQLDAN